MSAARIFSPRVWLHHALYLAASLLLFWMLHAANGADATASRFEKMIEGTADKPYVYRQLLPFAARAVRAVAMPQVERRQSFDDDFLRRFPHIVERFSWPHSHLFEYSIVAILQVLCFFATLQFLRVLVAHFTDFSANTRDFAPLGTLLLLPFFFNSGKHIYDPPTLFFSTLLLWLLAKQKTRYFFIAFFFACCNKETALLWIPIFLLASRENDAKVSRKSWNEAACLLLIWLAIKAVLWLHFHGNGGSLTEFHLDNTLNLWRKPQFLIFGFVVALMGFLVARDWKQKPQLLRVGFLWTLFPLAFLCALLGALDEMRDYYEAVPFLFLLMLPTIGALVKRFSPHRAVSPTSAL